MKVLIFLALVAIAYGQSGDYHQKFVDMFKMVDTNGDNAITTAEGKVALTEAAAKEGQQVPPEVLEGLSALFDSVDSNSDQKISYDEGEAAGQVFLANFDAIKAAAGL